MLLLLIVIRIDRLLTFDWHCDSWHYDYAFDCICSYSACIQFNSV